MPRLIWIAPLASLLVGGSVSLTSSGQPPRQGPVQFPPREPLEGSVQNGYGGIVTEVTKDSIAIRWIESPGEKPKRFAVSETLAAGKVPKEPRRRPGEQPMYSVRPEEMYRLTDVKAGDGVLIEYARVNGVDICDHICIMWRPDRLIPPLPKEAEDLRDPREVWKAKRPGRPVPEVYASERYIPYHEQMNAFWARQAPMPREKGSDGPLISP